MKLIGLVVFVVVQVVFLPVALVGTIYLTIKQLLVSRRLGVSATAASVVGDRWALDRFGQRPDPESVRLYAVLPNGSPAGMWALTFPLWLQYRISGNAGLFTVPRPGEENIAQLGMTRSVRFDDLIRKVLDEVDQFVLLGAGYDTRAYGAFKREGLRFFELDQPRTIALKQDALARAGIDASHVAFVGVDFGVGEWSAALRSAGYAVDRPAVFLWEGVTIYLSEQEVRDTLRQFASLAAPGSVLLADFYSAADVKPLGRLTAAAGERMHFGLELGADPVASVRAFVESEGLELGAAQVMGDKTRHGAFGVIAELRTR